MPSPIALITAANDRYGLTDEWERYCATVSDWDVGEYLDILP